MDDGDMDKSARFFLLIDGCEVWGVYRLIFSFDSWGEIAEISSYFNPPKEYKGLGKGDSEVHSRKNGGRSLLTTTSCNNWGCSCRTTLYPRCCNSDNVHFNGK